MASLRSMIQDRRIGVMEKAPATNPERFNAQIVFTIEKLKDRDTIAEDALPVWNDIFIPQDEEGAKGDYAGGKIPRCMPPFETMWLEANYRGRRFGVLTGRIAKGASVGELRDLFSRLISVPSQDLPQLRDSAAQIRKLHWKESGGYAFHFGDTTTWFDSSGENVCSLYECHYGSHEPTEKVLEVQNCWVLHTFARLNCANVRLAPRADGRRHGGSQRRTAPFSVWHEIQVDSFAKIRAREKTAAPDGAHREVRFHWVRGHYADILTAPAYSAIRNCERCSGYRNIAPAARSWGRWLQATRFPDCPN